MLHDFLSQHQRVVDFLAWTLAGVTVGSLLSQIAVVVTIMAGLGSLSLVALRWHDRLRYGPKGAGE